MEMPEHVGIIMDGNRRWSKENDKSKFQGHLEGKKRAEEILEKGIKMGIKAMSFYTFSVANMRRRPDKEKEYLLKVFARTFAEWADKDIIHENEVRFVFSGRWREMMPDYVRKSLEKAVEKTKDYDNHVLNYCLVYDGRDEVVDAVKDIADKAEDGDLDIDEIKRETIKNNLYYDLPNPDLIIRTGMKNAKRLSGFLLWGSAYAEFKFHDVYWPEYTPEILERDVKEWLKRRRSSHGK